MARRNEYTHSIDLKSVKIQNCERDAFRQKLENLPYRGYEVESLKDGRKIVITKPGGKSTKFGAIKKEDFLVFIYTPEKDILWQITHKQIYQDLENKLNTHREAALLLFEALEKVYNGEEPDMALAGFSEPKWEGESGEALVKVYKWIWGQEDVNYPGKEGRAMSWKKLEELRVQSETGTA